jgi:hypothetical protein
MYWFLTAFHDDHRRVDLWNAQLYLQFARAQLPARDLSEWLRRNSVPLCAFMPDRLTDAAAHTANQRDFQSLSRSLTQNQMVSVPLPSVHKVGSVFFSRVFACFLGGVHAVQPKQATWPRHSDLPDEFVDGCASRRCCCFKS